MRCRPLSHGSAARQRLRSATVALGAASLVAAGAIAYTLPSGAAHTTTTTAAAGRRRPRAAAPPCTPPRADPGWHHDDVLRHRVGFPAPAASSGTSHATSGGS